MDAGRALVLAKRWWLPFGAGVVLATDAFMQTSASSVSASSGIPASTMPVVPRRGVT